MAHRDAAEEPSTASKVVIAHLTGDLLIAARLRDVSKVPKPEETISFGKASVY